MAFDVVSRAQGYVWSVNTLSWTKAQQAIIDGSTVTITASGLATEAKQDTGNTSLAAIKTSVELIDNIVSGTGANISQFAGTNAVTGTGVATGALRVELANNGFGRVFASAGTDLNTSLLALENGNLYEISQTVKDVTDTFDTGQFALGIAGRVDTAAPTYFNTQAVPLSFTTAGSVRTSVTNTVDVTGTVTANAGTNLNTSTLLTTAAHDAAFGTAGSADAQVRSVQGIASMTPLQVQSNSLSLATQTTAAAIQTSVELIDNIVSGAGANISQFAGTNATSGSGTSTGALRVELPTNGTGVIATVGAVTAITNALPTGSNAIGKLAANSGVDIGDVDITSVTSAFANAKVDASGSTVTANAGTNLNTSLLALEATQLTGNTSLATIATNTTSLIPARGSTSVSQVGPVIMAEVSDTSSAFTDNTLQPLSMTSDGRLRVSIASESYAMTPWGDIFSWGNDGQDIDNYPASAW